MPVLVIDVPHRSWNSVQLSADLHGVDMTPDLPTSVDRPTTVQLTGPAWSLLNTFRKTPGDVRFKAVYPFVDRDPEPEVVP